MGDTNNKRNAGADESIEFFSSLLEAVPARVLRLDSELRVRYVNHATSEDMLGKSALDFMTPAAAETARAALSSVLETGEPITFEGGFSTDGAVEIYRTHVTRVDQRDGARNLCLVVMEITAERERETALRESEEKLRAAVDATRVGLWSWNPRTNEVVWDARMRAITGHETPRNAALWFDDLLHPEERSRFRNLTKNLAPLKQSPLDHMVYRIQRPDGEVRWLLSAATTYCDAAGVPERVVGGVIDVTEQHLVEDELRHARRMEAVGSLTAGIAHNFNNMLTVIQPCLDVLRDVVPEEFREHIADATQASQRAADMVRDLAAFAGKRTGGPRQTQVAADLARDTVSICRRTFEKHLTIELTSHTSVSIHTEPGAFGQVLMNLMLRARDGLLWARTKQPRIVVDIAEVALDGATFLRMSVTDNGPAIDANVREHIFEPFLTTQTGMGTGLGLASSHSLVTRHGGRLECASTTSEGTQFDCLFPIEKGGAPRTASSPQAELPRGSASVLLIDDEIAIQRIVSRVLRSAGFSIEAVAGPEEAKRTLSRRQDFDLVLLDRSLPGAPGSALVGHLREKLPGSLILFFTGELVDKKQAAVVDGVIRKPTRPAQLLKIINDALRNKRER